MISESPGQMVGSMLLPVAGRCRVSCERSTWAASSHLTFWISVREDVIMKL